MYRLKELDGLNGLFRRYYLFVYFLHMTIKCMETIARGVHRPTMHPTAMRSNRCTSIFATLRSRIP